MADLRGRKRQWLFGSDYKKISLGRESSAAKQKNPFLKFIKRPASDEAHNNHNKDSSSDFEDQNLVLETKFGTEKETNRHQNDNKGQDDNDEWQLTVDVIESVDSPSDRLFAMVKLDKNPKMKMRSVLIKVISDSSSFMSDCVPIRIFWYLEFQCCLCSAS